MLVAYIIKERTIEDCHLAEHRLLFSENGDPQRWRLSEGDDPTKTARPREDCKRRTWTCCEMVSSSSLGLRSFSVRLPCFDLESPRKNSWRPDQLEQCPPTSAARPSATQTIPIINKNIETHIVLAETAILR